MHSRFTRREILSGSLALLAAGCTSHTAESPLPQVEDDPPLPLGPLRSAPDSVPLTAAPGPELVLVADSSAAVSGYSSVISVYADGRVLRIRREGMFEEERPSKPPLLLATIDAGRVAVLQGLMAREEFLRGDSSYHQPNMHDGGAITYIGGPQPRRIIVINDPPGLPPVFTELAREVEQLDQLLDSHGVDAFKATGGLLVEHRRRFHSRSHSDLLLVFADGVLDYRVVGGKATVAPDADFPYPIVGTRRVDPAALQPLAAAARALRDATWPKPPEGVAEFRVRRGTLHFLQTRGRARTAWDMQHPPPQPIERVLLETAWLRAIFEAPPDEPFGTAAEP